jgi:general secretion pathway protein A
MYERFYGLNQHPFSLTPDSDFLFLNGNFQKSLDRLTYAMNRREAFSVLIGDVGTGKTTLCWALLLRMPQNVRTALILNPLLDTDDLLRAVIQDFKIKPRHRRAPWRTLPVPDGEELQDASWLDGLTRKQLIDELNRFLLEGAKDDVRSILIIDESQNLSPECLEQLRVLSNLETSKHKLLQILFSGQLELEQKLNLPQLRQLKQRISVRCSLQPLSKEDMARYIHHRLRKAGSNRSPTFSRGALNSIHRHSGGYPRLVNLICDRALMAGYQQSSRIITKRMAKAGIGNLAAAKSKADFKFFSFLLRFAATLLVGLMIFGGIFYYIRTRGHDVGSTDYQTAIQPVPDNAETPATEMPQEPAAPLPFQPKTSADASSRPLPNSGFSLQVHSLTTQEDAKRAVADLRQKGYPAYQNLITNRDDTRWYVVYLGPFDDIETARETAEDILERQRLQTILRTSSSPGIP